MKLVEIAMALALVSTPAAALAQSGDMKGMDMKDHKGMDMKDHKGMDMKGMKSDRKAQGQAHKATGKVTKVDSAQGSVTIAHEPVPSMKWPSMTMTFKVKDKAMLDKLPANRKVQFDFVQQGKDYVITSVK